MRPCLHTEGRVSRSELAQKKHLSRHAFSVHLYCVGQIVPVNRIKLNVTRLKSRMNQCCAHSKYALCQPARYSDMALLREVRLVGTGSAFPGAPVTNAELLREVNIGVSEEWIDKKVKIKTRYVSRARDTDDVTTAFRPGEGMKNSDLCTEAITKALELARIDKSELNMIIVSTGTPDYPIPGTAPIVQEKLGIKECAVMDVRSACCGAMTAMIAAVQYLRTGFFGTIAVVGCEVGSVFGLLDKDDPRFSKQDAVNACMIGDGAGAFILKGFAPSEVPYGIEIEYMNLNSIGMGKEPGMWLPMGGSVYPPTIEGIEKGLNCFKHEFRTILQHGPELFLRGMNDCLEATNTAIGDYDLFIPHQANSMIAENAPKFGVPRERMFENFSRIGNTANASCFICVDEVVRGNMLPEDARVMMCAAESTKWLYVVMAFKWHSLTGEKSLVQRRSTQWFWRRWMSGAAFWIVYRLARLRSMFGI